MFGTFEWERDDEKIVYGLVVDQVDHNLQRFACVVVKVKSCDGTHVINDLYDDLFFSASIFQSSQTPGKVCTIQLLNFSW